jgi:hypothetical protein
MKKIFLTGMLIAFAGLITTITAIPMFQGIDEEPVEPISIEIIAEPDNPRLGDTFDIIIRTDNADGIFFIEAEIGTGTGMFELTGLQPGALFGSEALYVGDYINGGKIGFSATSVNEELAGDGVLFQLNMQVSENASAIAYNLAVENFRAVDKEGNTLDIVIPGSVPVTVRSYVSWANFQTPGSVAIDYGFSVETEARIVVPDVTSSNGPDDDISAWIGISASPGEPWQWPENVWVDADYAQRTTNSHVFRRTVGSDLQSGTYYLASRFRYQDDDFVYGGYSAEGGGFWDGNDYVSGMLVVNEPGMMVVAEWNFDDDSMLASKGVFANINKEFDLIGANHTGFITGSPGRAATSNGWNGIDPDLEKYWLAAFSTEELRNLSLSYKMKSSGTGPRDFMLQASIDTLIWTDLLDEHIQITDNFNNTTVTDFELPENLNNQETVYLRWLLVSDSRVSESDEPVTSTGSSQIDEVKITGRPIIAQFPEIWPGDTNNDGVVDETDVLPLGFYWRSSGPVRAVTGSEWQAMPAVGWIPLNSTFADTDGSGTINQSDLLAIGLNFGNTPGAAEPETEPDDPGPASVQSNAIFTFSPFDAGKMLEIDLIAKEEKDVLGVSYSYTIHGGMHNTMEVRNAQPGSWAVNGFDDNILRFQRQSGEKISGAVVFKGQAESGKTTHLITLRIAALENLEEPLSLGNFTMKYIGSDGLITKVDNFDTNFRVVTATGIERASNPEIPAEYRLGQNYPNPFNPTTLINFDMPYPGDVRIDIFSVTGQHILTLVDEFRQAGSHSIKFNASHLASGVYLYRMQTAGMILTNKMSLIK